MWRPADQTLLTLLEAEAALRALGVFDETARRLAPLALAFPGLGPLEVPEVAALVRLDAAALHRATVLATRRLASAADARAAVAGWASLGARHQSYLAEIAEASTGSCADAAAVLEHAHLRGLEAVGRTLALEAETLSLRGAELRSVLGEARELARAAGAGARAESDLGRRSEQISLSLVEALVAPIARALDDLRSTAWTAPEAATWLARAERAWRWSGQDVAIAEFVVQAVPDLAWPLHQAQRWDELRTLLGPIEAPSEHLAARLVADPTDVAFRASTAQALVFLAETAGTLERQIELAERALLLCSTLRNARVVCADRIACKAEGMLLRSGSDEATNAADTLALRARELYPALRRLPALEAQIARRRAAHGGERGASS